MSTRLLKDKIDEVRVPQFQLAYICNTTHPSHKKLVNLCRGVNYMWWENQYLELQEWDDCIKSNKTRILAIIMLVPNKNQKGYKERVILFVVGKTMAGYKHGRPMPVLPRKRSRLPQGIPLNGVPDGGMTSLQVKGCQASNTSKAHHLSQMHKTR